MNLNAIENVRGVLPLPADDDARPTLVQRIREASGVEGAARVPDVPGAYPIDDNGTTRDVETASHTPNDEAEDAPGDVDVNVFFLNIFRLKMWTDWFDEGNQRFEDMGAV
ncbi:MULTISPECIES: hypothetical protein [Pandoraea]|jgi:hypothetical protein|uniref:Uncharacterized protein n=1 Tax=Pandoraea pnomenusa TaxID=93220 RepID=A0A378YR79_9BURK|nr:MULTISPECIES: hypothetical protein [Pandoraea]AHB08723.1 hypothetical protein U875_22840 [Pandoraea pnomenusa 3kgm]AHB78489.1 hypothetical protein X636_11335 [Pandoraea pnomenusa]AHN77534.1 hypothetical protein DA70_15515 [Pandoraea pnomenusa]AIU27699.1 hypothetical protein LV28_15160 [Pandoraea pnomenusa]ANC44845.1 hypothetical protein A6P55_12265 [Pandoraea pnomenusa]